MSFEEQAASLDRDAIVDLLVSQQKLTKSVNDLAARNEELSRQLDWFKRQLFGTKSERRIIDADARQLALGESFLDDASAPEPSITVPEHRRRTGKKRTEADESGLRFDDSVPVEEIRIPHPDINEATEVVSEKITYRLAQRAGTYCIVKIVRPVVKSKETGVLSAPPAPPAVLGKSIADVSLLACMVIDKFVYHLPLYRQHQRMEAAGIRLARSTLTNLMHRTADLLSPIYHAQLDSILKSRVLTMDETPIRAGRKKRGELKTGYFWPVYGDKNEIAFPFSPTRAGGMVREVLGEYCGVFLSDGYKVYETYAASVNGVVHAQCWSHTRRQFLKAEGVEPELTKRALALIRRLYKEEGELSKKGLDGAKKLEKRAVTSMPVVNEFFEWLKTELTERVLLPSSPFTKAMRYALEREASLRVFLKYPDVPIDTNHIEREIRPIALGRKNWLFCWTEVGAQGVGIFQSLLATCRVQGVDPYTYLVDVLQRVDEHPAAQVATLTPRLWKEHFAADPLRSHIDRVVKNADS